MQMLYDSDQYAVVHVDVQPLNPYAPVHNWFEIIDKETNKEVFLAGDWAMAFQNQINAWKASTPHVDEVEETLAGYAELAQLPLCTH